MDDAFTGEEVHTTCVNNWNCSQISIEPFLIVSFLDLDRKYVWMSPQAYNPEAASIHKQAKA